jgi:hypothetical protein
MLNNIKSDLNKIEETINDVREMINAIRMCVDKGILNKEETISALNKVEKRLKGEEL